MDEPTAVASSRKRPLEDASLQNSSIYKIRAVLRDLRPHFIEVLKTPDFRNCKAAEDIRQGMKLLMELYREVAEQCVKLEKCSNSGVINGQMSVEYQEDVMKPGVDVLHEDVLIASENQFQGGRVVGGSAFGWNFVTFRGPEAVYYGRTKQDFRSANAN